MYLINSAITIIPFIYFFYYYFPEIEVISMYTEVEHLFDYEIHCKLCLVVKTGSVAG
jgi:hypothetical protein